MSTPRAGSQTRPGLRCATIGDPSTGELGPAEEIAVSFDIDRARTGTDFADGVVGSKCTPTEDTVVMTAGPFGEGVLFGLAAPGGDDFGGE